MNRGLSFFLIVFIGLGLCAAGFYYIFWYQAPKSDAPLGVVIDSSVEDYNQIDEDYSENKAGVAQLYIDWGDIESNREEYNWSFLSDQINFFNKKGYRVSVCLKIIDGYGLGGFPDDFVYDDLYNDDYQDRLYNFIFLLLNKYQGEVDYFVLGSEVDKYLSLNYGELEGFSLFYNTMYYRIKTDFPDMQVGTSISYDTNFNRDSLILEEDFVGFTFYNIDFSHNVLNVDQADRAFEDMLNQAGDKKLALVSTGLSTAAESNGNNDKQAVFVEKLIKFVANNKDKVEFANYYLPQDLTMDNCLELSEEQLWNKLKNSSACQTGIEFVNNCSREMISVNEKEKVAKWWCGHGLRNDLGVPKEGLYSWQEAIQGVSFE